MCIHRHRMCVHRHRMCIHRHRMCIHRHLRDGLRQALVSVPGPIRSSMTMQQPAPIVRVHEAMQDARRFSPDSPMPRPFPSDELPSDIGSRLVLGCHVAVLFRARCPPTGRPPTGRPLQRCPTARWQVPGGGLPAGTPLPGRPLPGMPLPGTPPGRRKHVLLIILMPTGHRRGERRCPGLEA